MLTDSGFVASSSWSCVLLCLSDVPLNTRVAGRPAVHLCLREGRDLSTTGWYMGALMSGSCVVVLKIWPAIYQDEYPLWTIGIWTAITLFMVSLLSAMAACGMWEY